MACGKHLRPVHLGSGFSSEAQGPADGKRRLIRGEGLVARISDDYRPQLPVVGKDIPGPAAPCHVGTAWSEETVNIQTRSVGGAVRCPCSDSEESDNDVLYAEEHDSALQQVNLWKEWLIQTTVDSCGEGCAQLDDFKWFLPTDARAENLSAPELEIKTSDSESGVDFIEPDSTPLQTETTTQRLLRPPVVVQTRPMEGCHTAVPRRLHRGRDVRTADDAVAVDARQVSAASDTVVYRMIHRKSECVTTVGQWLLRLPTRLFSRDLQTTVTRTPSLRGAGVSIRPGLILRKPRYPAWKWPVEVLRPKLVEVLQPKLTSAEVRIGYTTDRDVRDDNGNGRWKSSGRYRHLRGSGLCCR